MARPMSSGLASMGGWGSNVNSHQFDGARIEIEKGYCNQVPGLIDVPYGEQILKSTDDDQHRTWRSQLYTPFIRQRYAKIAH